jgi:hypothetical protein
MATVISWIKARAGERSTWLGLVTLLSAAGVALTPEQASAIVTLGTGLFGAIMAFTADKPAPQAEVKPQWEQPK